MSRIGKIILYFNLFLLPIVGFLQAGPFLKVGPNGRYLFDAQNHPFFYLGDTAWMLFHRLSLDEARTYLSNRAEKGFTVIQAVVLAELGGTDTPNTNGDYPLKNMDPARPNEAYFRHIDAVVDAAEELGLVIGMLPTWGSYWSENNPGRQIFNPENASEYGRFLGKRYKNRRIIWILGGDQNIRTDTERKIIDAMAMGLREGDGGEHLITFHPRGPGLSSEFLQDADWLDFHMVQSSHASRDHDNGLFIDHDVALDPLKPTLDGEPRYEHIPVGFYFKDADRLLRFDDFDCRQAIYWALLAGACGHTYGHNSVWQMWTPDRDPVIWAAAPWQESLDHPGAFQMGIVRKLFESRPFHKLRPNQKLILDGPKTGGSKIRAAFAEDASFLFIYSPYGESFTVDKRVFKGKRNKEIWFDPRYGVSTLVHTPDTRGIQTYTPPTKGRGQDWILIIEDAEAGFGMP